MKLAVCSPIIFRPAPFDDEQMTGVEGHCWIAGADFKVEPFNAGLETRADEFIE